MKSNPATKSSNLMIEVDKVICVDMGVYTFYMCLYVYKYKCLYRCFICFSVRLFMLVHIVHIILKSHCYCILIYIILFVYTEKFA